MLKKTKKKKYKNCYLLQNNLILMHWDIVFMSLYNAKQSIVSLCYIFPLSVSVRSLTN